jgi:hypothetical protein
MARHTRRWALLLVALAILAVALVACGLPSGYSLPNRSAATMSTPAKSSSPTPAFSPFTIGAWPSNFMPGAGDSVTIYVICRIQDPTMADPATPAVGQTVYVRLLDPVNRTYKGTTGDDGIARARVAFDHARAYAYHHRGDSYLEGDDIPERDIVHAYGVKRVIWRRHAPIRRNDASGDGNASASLRTDRDSRPCPADADAETRPNGHARTAHFDTDTPACGSANRHAGNSRAMTRDAHET